MHKKKTVDGKEEIKLPKMRRTMYFTDFSHCF